MSSRQRTEKAIRDAFNGLIRTHPFHLITIEKICQEADVSRATFYRYYKDKYEVMNDNYRVLLSDCLKRPCVHDFASLYVELFSEAHADFWVSIRNSFGSAGYNSFSAFIASHSFETAEKLVLENRHTPFTEAERLQMHVFTQGIARVYEDWTFGRYALSSKEAGEALYLLMPASLRITW